MHLMGTGLVQEARTSAQPEQGKYRRENDMPVLTGIPCL
jgi:hypothetical protein